MTTPNRDFAHYGIAYALLALFMNGQVNRDQAIAMARASEVEDAPAAVIDVLKHFGF